MNRLLLVLLIGVASILPTQAQNSLEEIINETERSISKIDSISAAYQDSVLIEDLKLQIQQLKLKEIVLRNEANRDKEHTLKSDSIKRANQLAQIDSLRNHTKGVSLVIEKDTLLTLYAQRGGLGVKDRIKRAEQAIMVMGKTLTMRPDSIYIFESEHATDIMGNEKVILTLTDLDGLWQNTTRQQLANQYLPLITNKVHTLHQEYGLTSKLKSIALAVLVILMQVLLVFVTYKLFRRLRYYIYLKRNRLRPLKIKDYEFLNIHKQVRILMFASRIVRLIVVILQLLLTIPMLFAIFPETEEFAFTIFFYFWNPIRDIFGLIIGYLPRFIKIFIIYFCFRYINKGLKYFANEIANGKLHITGFYDDWAYPTYYILRVLLYSFMFVMIWPLLPNSESPIFQGVSVFVGLVLSLGSTTVIGNLMAGMVLTYMRSFKIGDEIKLSDEVKGTVIEKTPFVTRIRTPKHNIITIPNSTIMSAQTVNYTMSAHKQGVIVHTNIGVAYNIDRNYAEKLLLEAAKATKGLLAHPEPFVLVVSLDDFYCTYQINAFTRDVKALARVYSRLHASILDKFNEADIEIVAPHYYAQRDGNTEVKPPKKSRLE